MPVMAIAIQNLPRLHQGITCLHIEITLQHLEPSLVVEIIVWLSVLQLLNSLSSYYRLIKTYKY